MQRIHSLDVLPLVIACGVVWAHAMLMTNHSSVPAYILGQGLARTVVPTFAVLSGFFFYTTLHRRKADDWLLCLLVFYLFWTAVYLPLWWPKPPSVIAFAEGIVFGSMHLWYMAALLVALTLLKAIVQYAPSAEVARRRLLWTAVPAMLAGTAIQSADFFTDLNLPLNSFRNGLFYEFPFAVFGYLVAERVKRDGLDILPRAAVLWLIVAGLALLRLGEAWLSLQYFGLSIIAPPEFPVLTVAFAVGVVLATLRTRVRAVRVNFAFASMMIYFLHVGFLAIAVRLGIHGILPLMVIGVGMPLVCSALLSALVRTLYRLYPGASAWRWVAVQYRQDPSSGPDGGDELAAERMAERTGEGTVAQRAQA